ncbi:MAG: hypothetical protein WB439_03245, partial [Acidobacteriaceae bacterium]
AHDTCRWNTRGADRCPGIPSCARAISIRNAGTESRTGNRLPSNHPCCYTRHRAPRNNANASRRTRAHNHVSPTDSGNNTASHHNAAARSLKQSFGLLKHSAPFHTNLSTHEPPPSLQRQLLLKSKRWSLD